MTRTYCEYGDCDLEKLEKEFVELKALWLKLKKNWSKPVDWEDLYRLYPLITVTSALSRQRIDQNQSYNVKIVLPKIGDKTKFDEYFYADEHKFFNGVNTYSSLKNVTSSFLHAKNYVYMDTRKSFEIDTESKIYLFVATDHLCPSCNEANIGDPKKKYGKKSVGYIDCTCGQYIDIDSFVSNIESLIAVKIKNRTK
jgi:hypothetical protein